MKSLVYTLYKNGQAGLSNLIMSLELGVVLARLTDRVLVLKGNTTPAANVVQYGGAVENTYPSRATDLIELGVPWIDFHKINVAAFAPHDICDQPAWDCLFYFPAHLSIESDDFWRFAGRRDAYITIGEDLERVPALSFSGGPDSQTLSFYSYFFYLDRAAQLRAHDALVNMKPRDEFTAFAMRVSEDLGPFNAVHIRRGDFKKTMGVTTLDRKPAEAIHTLDYHFSRDNKLVILTDEADDPFFDEIKAAYADHVFLDRHILESHGSEFLDLPAHDSIALAYLSQLVAARSRDFVGSMTSTFTSLIQRMRGNLGQDEPFKFLWNELPGPGDDIEPGSHPASDCIPLDKGIMVEERDDPYSWNRYSERINPAWMREWPEGFLNETAMIERAGDREFATLGAAADVTVAPTPQAGGSSCTISFLGGGVVAGSNRDDVTTSMRQLFELMAAPSDGSTPEVRIEARGGNAELVVDGKVVGEGTAASALLRSFYREIVCRFIDRHQDLIWLHAGCVASPAGAVLLPGAWGRGKSSLVMELYNRGWSFLSDDIAPLEPVSGTVVPFPGTPQIRSRTEKELQRNELCNLSKSAVSLDPTKVANGPQPLSMIVFPHYAKGAAAELTPLSPGQAVGELLENCLSFAKNEDATIRRLCAVVEALPVYSLRFSDAGDAAEMLIEANMAAKSAGAGRKREQANEIDIRTAEGVQSIDVEVTLTDGLRYFSVLPSNSPILHDLYAALAAGHARDPQQPAILVQLPLDGGHAACSFVSTSLVSVTTRPPVLVQAQLAQSAQREGAPGTDAPVYVRIDDFLTPDENEQLLNYVLASETEFESSSVTAAVEGYRKSRVLYSIKHSKWRDIFMARLNMHLPHIASTLNAPDFRIGRSEIQLTASNDGDFFKAHADASHEATETADREITYVYYLHRTPRPYSGGGLLLYHGEPGQLAYDLSRAVSSIAPQNNCLIAFASNRWHEVELVRCPSAQFADGRFTVNGWLRRQRS